MLKVENIEVCGFEPAIRGMRNPKNSWGKSDSHFDYENPWCWERPDNEIPVCIGDNDLDLMKRLFNAGTEHRKYDRMIQVYMDITAPLYWWKEFDTYKIGTVANSCSTMHKIHDKEFTLDDFSHEHLMMGWEHVLKTIIKELNHCREQFLISKNKVWWWQMIQLLPSSYNQKRTVMMNYEVVARIIEQRSNHKLDEWHQLVDVLKTLPYIQEIMK